MQDEISGYAKIKQSVLWLTFGNYNQNDGQAFFQFYKVHLLLFKINLEIIPLNNCC